MEDSRLFGYILNAFRLLDLGFCSVADKDRLASPFDNDILPLRNRSEINFDFSLCQDVGRGRHVDQEVYEALC